MDNKNSMMIDDGLVMIHRRNDFYKKKYYFILFLIIINIIVIFALGNLVIYLRSNPVQPLYFVADSLGRLIPDIPLTVPNMSLDEVSAWTVKAVESAYSYDFMNYRSELQNAQRYFSDYGWRNYMQGLTNSNNLVGLTQRKMVFIAHVIDKPKLIREGVLNSAYAWKFQMRLLVNYLEPPYDKPSFSNAFVVTTIVQRQKLLQSDQGLAILQMIASAPS